MLILGFPTGRHEKSSPGGSFYFMFTCLIAVTRDFILPQFEQIPMGRAHNTGSSMIRQSSSRTRESRDTDGRRGL